MRLVVDNELNKIYNNYINNNFKEIIINGNNNKYNIKLLENNSINEYINYENNLSLSKYQLINLIVKDFISKNRINSCNKCMFECKNSINLENDKNQNILIYSNNINKNFPHIIDMIENINVISNNTYSLIDDNLIDRLEIHYTKLANSYGKSILHIKSKKLLKILISGELNNIDEIIDFIKYYKEINGSYNETTIIDFNNYRNRKEIIFDNNKELIIYGKVIIDYIERGKVYGKINNGKISKFM